MTTPWLVYGENACAHAPSHTPPLPLYIRGTAHHNHQHVCRHEAVSGFPSASHIQLALVYHACGMRHGSVPACAPSSPLYDWGPLCARLKPTVLHLAALSLSLQPTSLQHCPPPCTTVFSLLHRTLPHRAISHPTALSPSLQHFLPPYSIVLLPPTPLSPI